MKGRSDGHQGQVNVNDREYDNFVRNRRNGDKCAQENATVGNCVHVSIDFQYRGVEGWRDYCSGWSIETGNSRDG